MTTPDPQANPSSPQDPGKVTVPEVPSVDFSIPDAPEVETAAEIPAPEVPAFETGAEISVPEVPSFEAAAEVPAPEVPAPEAPTFPQASAPSFDEATATPGSTTYGTAYDVPAADAYAQAEQQPAYGVPGPEANSQAPYGQPGFEQAAYAAGQQAYGQPGYAQTAYAQPVVAGAPKQWMVALLLGFFLGGFGIHNFYLGYTTRGIIQLVLTITVFGAPITGVWVLIELIMILMRSGSYAYDAQGVPLQ